MWELIKLYTSKSWTFFKPILRLFFSAAQPIIQQLATQAVRQMATKYSGQLVDRATRNMAHEEAYTMIVEEAVKAGIDMTEDGINSLIDMSIKAAAKQLEN